MGKIIFFVYICKKLVIKKGFNMKKLPCLCLCLCLVLCASAQTQQGIVKTKGRRATSVSAAQKGAGLSGATIQLKDRKVVSGSGGAFSFPVRSGRYVIQSVKKQGYVLVDPDVLTKQYSYSTNPLTLVLETPTQQADDKLEAEHNLRVTLQRQLTQREEEIRQLKRDNQITHEQYQQAMRDLYALQQSNERLIAEMAERYAMIDYDQMDDFTRQLDDLLLNGDLVRADSLLRASVNDIDSYIADIHSERAIQEAEQAELERRQDNLAQSRQGTQAKADHAAKVCYGHFVKFVMENEPDSAAAYIERRATIDDGDVQYQFDAASFFQKRGVTDKARYYYDRALSAARAMGQENQPLLAHTLNNVALLYPQQSRNNEAEPLFQEALTIYRRLNEENPQVYQRYVASTLNNLALHYANNYYGLSQSEPLFTEALEIYRALSEDDAHAFQPQVASVLSNLGILFDENNRFNDSEQAYQEALSIYRALATATPAAFDPDVASTLNNMSALYFRNDVNGKESVEMLREAADIYRRLATQDLPLHGDKLAAVLLNLAVQCNAYKLTAEADGAVAEALAVYRRLVESGRTQSRPVLALKTYEQGITFFQRDEMAQSELLLRESAQVYRELAELEPDTYQPLLARSLRNLATVFDKLHRWDEGGQCYQEELDINRHLAESNPGQYNADMARSWGNLSSHVLYTGDFGKAIEYARNGLECDSTKLFIQANLALAHLCQGDIDQAKAIYQQYKGQLRDTFLDDLSQLEALGVIPRERQDDVAAVREFLSR